MEDRSKRSIFEGTRRIRPFMGIGEVSILLREASSIRRISRRISLRLQVRWVGRRRSIPKISRREMRLQYVSAKLFYIWRFADA